MGDTQAQERQSPPSALPGGQIIGGAGDGDTLVFNADTQEWEPKHVGSIQILGKCGYGWGPGAVWYENDYLGINTYNSSGVDFGEVGPYRCILPSERFDRFDIKMGQPSGQDGYVRLWIRQTGGSEVEYTDALNPSGVYMFMPAGSTEATIVGLKIDLFYGDEIAFRWQDGPGFTPSHVEILGRRRAL